MTLEQLQYALAVYQYQSMIKAAEANHVSQPALSMQLKKLEDEIGFQIFDRNNKPLRITELGLTFMEKVKELMLSYKGLKSLADELRNNENGQLKVGVIPTLAPFLLPLFVRQFNKLYPEIELHITELTTEEILGQIKDGKLDTGIIATPVSVQGLVFEALFYERFYIYVAEDHPLFLQQNIRLEDIGAKDLWLLKEGNCFRNQINDICHLGQRHAQEKFSYESSSIASLMRIVEHQGGITFIPELATLGVNAAQENMLRDIEGQNIVREISLVYSKWHYKKNTFNQLKYSILENIPQHMVSPASYEVVDSFIRF